MRALAPSLQTPPPIFSSLPTDRLIPRGGWNAPVRLLEPSATA